MNDDDFFPEDTDFSELYEEDDAPQPRWTLKRVLVVLIILLILASLIAYELAPLFDQTPIPPPPTIPRALA